MHLVHEVLITVDQRLTALKIKLNSVFTDSELNYFLSKLFLNLRMKAIKHKQVKIYFSAGINNIKKWKIWVG